MLKLREHVPLLLLRLLRLLRLLLLLRRTHNHSFTRTRSAAAASLLHVLAETGGDIWDGQDAIVDPRSTSRQVGGEGAGGDALGGYAWLPKAEAGAPSAAQVI